MTVIAIVVAHTYISCCKSSAKSVLHQRVPNVPQMFRQGCISIRHKYTYLYATKAKSKKTKIYIFTATVIQRDITILKSCTNTLALSLSLNVWHIHRDSTPLASTYQLTVKYDSNAYKFLRNFAISIGKKFRMHANCFSKLTAVHSALTHH